MADQRDIYRKRLTELQEIIKNENLSVKEIKHLETALDLGYSAAFSSRTHDMRESFYATQEYQDGYESIKKSLKSLKAKNKSK